MYISKLLGYGHRVTVVEPEAPVLHLACWTKETIVTQLLDHLRRIEGGEEGISNCVQLECSMQRSKYRYTKAYIVHEPQGQDKDIA